MKRAVKLVIAALLSAVVSANALAFLHARAMTRFSQSGERTAPIEQLGLLDRIGVMLAGVSLPRPGNLSTPAKYNLPFETRRFLNPSGDSLESWYIAGLEHRPLIVMFHGYGTAKSSLLSAAQVFNELGYGTLLIDFFGSGGSSGSSTTVGVKEAEDVAAAVGYANSNWPQRKIILYGISMGGAALLRALALHGVSADGAIVEATFDSLLHTAKRRTRSLGLPASPFTELLLLWGSVQGGVNLFAHNPADFAAKITLPVLQLHGEQDQRVTLAEARSIALALGRHGRWVTFPGVPHTAIVTQRRAEWMTEVGQFLQQF